ncbi:MAG: hypothetical protein LAT51_07900 [Flavobacteriaceae bacterium]|nr:hypothetical protein [Flavobacteriaceae bacterium]
MRNKFKTQFFLQILLGLVLLTGCSDDGFDYIQNDIEATENKEIGDESNLETFDQNNDNLNYLSASDVINTLDNIKIISENENLSENEKVALINYQLSPYSDIGMTVMNHIITYHDLRELQPGLSDEEYLSIENPEDSDLALIGFIINLANAEGYDTYGWTGEQIRECLSFALGIQGIYELYKNTKTLANFGKKYTAKQTLKLVKLIGRRYLGWLGVGLMVYDFADCMSNFSE